MISRLKWSTGTESSKTSTFVFDFDTGLHPMVVNDGDRWLMVVNHLIMVAEQIKSDGRLK